MKARIIQVFLTLLLASPACVGQTLAFNEVKPEFGSVIVGKSGEPKIILISNVSTAPIFLTYVKATADFAQSSTCPMWLPEQSGCLVFITFTPTTTGTRTGQLYVDWAGGGEQSIPLSGVGQLTQATASEIDLHQAKADMRTTNDEEIANTMLNDKQYSFQALLSKNPADISNVKRIFALTKDTEGKERAASILLSLGVSDPIYFEYLTNEARKALAHDRDIPWPVVYGEDWTPKSANPATNEWCQKHNLSYWDVYNVSYLEFPLAWYFLGAAHDARAYDLIVKGLHSHNIMIVATAASGLAMLQDPRSIDELIATGRKVPGEARGAIAKALLFFPDPKAQAAAEEIMLDQEKNLLEIWRADIKAKGRKASFPW